MTSDDRRRRIVAGSSLILAVALGIASRRYPIGLGWWDKSLGDVLYATAVYLLLALLVPRLAPARLVLVSLAICTAIELFQLTGIPSRYAYLPPVRWIVGTHFALHDLVCYGIGLTAIGILHRLAIRPGRAYN